MFGVGLIGLGRAVMLHRVALRDLTKVGRVRIIGGDAPSPGRRVGFAVRWTVPVLDNVDAVNFENGAIGGIDATSVACPGFPECIEIAGTKASALFIGSRLEWYGAGGTPDEFDPGSGANGGADPMAFDHGPHRVLITEMLDAIEEERAPGSDLRNGLPVERLLEAWRANTEFV